MDAFSGCVRRHSLGCRERAGRVGVGAEFSLSEQGRTLARQPAMRGWDTPSRLAVPGNGCADRHCRPRSQSLQAFLPEDCLSHNLDVWNGLQAPVS